MMSVQFQPRVIPQAAPAVPKQSAAPANEGSGKLAARLVLRGVAQTSEFAGGMAGLVAGFAGGWLTFNSLNFSSTAKSTGYADNCGNNLPLTAFFRTTETYTDGQLHCKSPTGKPWDETVINNARDNQFLIGVGLAAISVLAPAIGNKIAAIARDWEQQIAASSAKPVK